MKIVFMGTPGFAVPVLDAVVAAGHEVVAAYCQPLRPGGRRGRELVKAPVQLRAEALGIAVRTPVSLRGAEAQEEFAGWAADVAVVAAYGLILPQAVLDMPRHGCLNVHASLLPRWRGAAPIQRAILAGDAETGVCIMQMAAGLDTGPVRLARRTAIGGKAAGALIEELGAMGARLMVEVLGDLAGHPAVAQGEDSVTYAAKIDKAEARIDFSLSAEAVERQVRAMNPPGAWFALGGERVRVLACEIARHAGPIRHPGADWDHVERAPQVESDPSLRWGDDASQVGVVLDDRLTIACGTGAIRPTLVQRAGRGVVSAAEFLRGFPLPPGTRLA